MSTERTVRLGIVGASGYSGAVATRLVASHPRLQLAFATSDRHAGESVADRLGAPVDAAARFVPNPAADAPFPELLDRCDAVLLATAADVSARLAPVFAQAGKAVVDLSGAFRLDAEQARRHYGLEHADPAWLARAHYGLPELFGAPPPPPPPMSAPAPAPAASRASGAANAGTGVLVANPGCYPTATLLALAPLVREGLVEPTGLVVDAKSGVTGAGRQSGEAYSFVEIDGDLRAYKVLSHQHTPEIARALSRGLPAGRAGDDGARDRGVSAARLTFTAHLLPISRGLMATCYGRPRPGATPARVAQCLADTYAGRAFVRVVPPEGVMLKRVVGTNLAFVGATADDDVVVAFGAIDNLLKGAAGQAVQNLNAIHGWDDTLGLEGLQRVAP